MKNKSDDINLLYVIFSREKENDEIRCVVEMYDNATTCVTESSGHTHNFTYDMSFWSFDENDPTFASQEVVYKSSAQPLLDGVFKGYNTCLFAYGQVCSNIFSFYLLCS